MSVHAATRAVPAWPAFRKLTLTEGRLLLREPVTLLWGVAFPMILLTVMGVFSAGPEADLGGYSLVAAYEPILIAFVTAALAVQTLPTVLASYRERGILRRLATTPAGAARVLAAQLTVNLGVALTGTAGLLAVGRLGFGVALPGQLPGFLVAVAGVVAAMLALALLVAALAPTGRSASVIGAILFLPMMFFAGLWTPRATMPHILVQISNFTPLGAAVQALQASMASHWPPMTALGVLAGCTVVCTTAAIRFFRWL